MTEPADRQGRGLEDADHVRADREATGWLLRLQEEPDDLALHASFEEWRGASPGNAAAWAEMEHVSRVIVAAAPVAGAAGKVVPLDLARARRDGRRPTFGRIVKFSVAAAAACLALIAGPSLLIQLRADAVAGTGELKTVRLADGSIAQLAPGGALAIDFVNGERRVRLLRGTAYFDVAHDPAHPFRIAAAYTTTTVLGTAFEVRHVDSGVAVAVRRGLVRVACDDRSASERLSVGQAVDMTCGAADRRGAVAPARVAAWVHGQFVADDRPMREVVDALRPWYRGFIITRGAGIDRRHITGVYDLRDPQGALAALAAAHRASVRQVTPWITVISAD